MAVTLIVALTLVSVGCGWLAAFAMFDGAEPRGGMR